MLSFILKRVARHRAGHGRGGADRVPAAAPLARRPGRRDRGRLRDRRADRENPHPARPQPADRPAIHQLARRSRARRSRRLDLLQSPGHHADRPAHRADLDAGAHHDRVLGAGRRAARRARRLEGAHLGRPRRDGVRGGRLLGAGVRDGLFPHLRLLARPALVPGSGLPQPVRRSGPVHQPHHAADAHALGDLHRADRAHHARERARSAGGGLHPHRARQGPGRDARCCSSMRSAMPPCRSSP